MIKAVDELAILLETSVTDFGIKIQLYKIGSDILKRIIMNIIHMLIIIGVK